jgi:hypothetical protein
MIRRATARNGQKLDFQVRQAIYDIEVQYTSPPVLPSDRRKYYQPGNPNDENGQTGWVYLQNKAYNKPNIEGRWRKIKIIGIFSHLLKRQCPGRHEKLNKHPDGYNRKLSAQPKGLTVFGNAVYPVPDFRIGLSSAKLYQVFSPSNFVDHLRHAPSILLITRLQKECIVL